jgi:hypothetical protein
MLCKQFKQEQVRFDVEEPESDGSVAQGFKGERHGLKLEVGRRKAEEKKKMNRLCRKVAVSSFFRLPHSPFDLQLVFI